MKILGIDPGLATMGWGVIDTNGFKHKLVSYGTITTAPGPALPYRLRSIYIGMKQLLETYEPDAVAFEELFFSKNVTTGIAVGGARGVAMVAACEYTDNMYEYTPMQIKQAVAGYGRADKQQVQQMVKMLLAMNEIAKPDDAADALAVAITHAHTGRACDQFKIR